MSEERDFTRKQRIIVVGLAWIVAVPLVIGFFVLNFWLGLVLAAVVLFTTWDYIRKGDTAGVADRSRWGF